MNQEELDNPRLLLLPEKPPPSLDEIFKMRLSPPPPKPRIRRGILEMMSRLYRGA